MQILSNPKKYLSSQVKHSPKNDSEQYLEKVHLLSFPKNFPYMHFMQNSFAVSQYLKSLSSILDLHFPSLKSI